MEENHLEYGYLEGESIGGHFAEDPVGVTVLCVLWPTRGVGGDKREAVVTFLVCAHVSSASRAATVTSASAQREQPRLRCCSIVV